MNTPISWIKAYVPDLNVTVQEYIDAMTLSGSHAEGYEQFDKKLANILVGKIASIERHPDADKLVVCQVDVGQSDLVQIVTGANNISENDLIPVVLDGGRVAASHSKGEGSDDGMKIKKGKLRGVLSNGMMCSIEELGSTHDMFPESPEDGIYIFGDDVKPGDDAIAALGLRDASVEFEITSNRVDCFSMVGMAREAAATFQKAFVPPVIKATGNDEKASDYIAVEVVDTDLCPRFTARVVTDIKLAPSPKWMQMRLRSLGIRPINNLVDITNYVMEEYGQPMHAYDMDTIAGNKIIVKCANKGQTFTTLDGQERKLDESMLMINDAEKPVGIAGIMGGENSMVTDNIQTLLLEAAIFNGTNIRRTGKKLGLRTDASGKFEKGLDPENAIIAMNRACQLIEELGAGTVIGGNVDVYPVKKEAINIVFEPAKINALLGTDIAPETMLGYLATIEIPYDKETNSLIIPTFRQDLECMADIAEEVARFYGYDKIVSTSPKGEATTGKISFKARVEAVSREVAEQNGFSGAMSYSFESPKVFDKLLVSQDSELRKAIVISNPLGEDFSIMRTVSLNGMLTSLATNYNHRNKSAKLYEFGNIYCPKELPLTELPDERMQFTLGMYGDGDFFTLKGTVEDLFARLGEAVVSEYEPTSEYPFLHPGRQARILIAGKQVGYMGQIHPEVGDNYNIDTEVYVAVIDMPVLVGFASFDRIYKGVPKFPAMNRDLSMVMKKEIVVGQIEKIIKEKGGKLLERFELFDVYEGDQIKAGYKSVAYSLVFRAKDRTLEEAEVNAVVEKILKELNALGIELRA